MCSIHAFYEQMFGSALGGRAMRKSSERIVSFLFADKLRVISLRPFILLDMGIPDSRHSAIAAFGADSAIEFLSAATIKR
jgi:hypothetical protein